MDNNKISEIKKDFYILKGYDLHKSNTNYSSKLKDYLNECKNENKIKLKDEILKRKRKVIYIHDSFVPNKSKNKKQIIFLIFYN